MDWSDRPQKYISWWTNDPTDGRSNITLQTLLSFTSGIHSKSPLFKSGFIGDNDRLPSPPPDCTSDLFDGLRSKSNLNSETCVQQIYNLSFIYAPGSTFDYGMNHMDIAGLMAIKRLNISTWEKVLLDSDVYLLIRLVMSTCRPPLNLATQSIITGSIQLDLHTFQLKNMK